MATKQVKPLSPNEVKSLRLESLDADMITAVNNLLKKKLDSAGCAKLLQKDIVDEYFKVKGVEKTDARKKKMHEDHQLDFEDVFRKAGWSVSYDKPGYNESYEASFEFKNKKKG